MDGTTDPFGTAAAAGAGTAGALYREAVYREYTALPADTAQAMQALAARAGIRTDGGTEETARQVAQYIGSAARYSLDTPVQPRDEDFVLHFLTQSRQGYCVHFASAAAVMLRALDIPARYVSGYVAVGTGRQGRCAGQRRPCMGGILSGRLRLAAFGSDAGFCARNQCAAGGIAFR